MRGTVIRMDEVFGGMWTEQLLYRPCQGLGWRSCQRMCMMRCVDILVLGGTSLHRLGFASIREPGCNAFYSWATPWYWKGEVLDLRCVVTTLVVWFPPVCDVFDKGLGATASGQFRSSHGLIVVWGRGVMSEVCVAYILCVVGRRSVGTSGNRVVGASERRGIASRRETERERTVASGKS